MKNNIKKIYYFARIDKDKLPGIYNKVKQTTDSFAEMGFNSELIVSDGFGDLKNVWRSMWETFFKLMKITDAEFIIIRIDIYMPLVSIALMWQRIIGTKIIAEIPSPIENWIKEVKTADGGGLKKLIKQFLIYVSFPWSLIPANKIIQYAPESRYFSFGLKKKMQLHANGIDIKVITKREKFPEWPQEKFIMIGVASFAKWHGFDRVIRGIAAFIANHPHNPIAPIFYVVGDGPIRKKWESLSKELNVENYVHFVGFKTGIDLDYLYNNSHVAISSLGLYSIGLEMSSTLKSREYTARGIPFVKSGEDIDFQPMPNFIYSVENNNINIDISDLMNWYTNLKYDNKMNGFIRDYAKRNLSFSSKSEKLININ